MCNAHEMRAADWQRTLAVNLSAPFYLIQAAIPHLLKAQGAVVNVTSSAAFVGEAYAAAYCAAKAGLNSPDQGARDGIRAQAHPLQRRRAGRDGHQHRPNPQNAAKASTMR